MASLDALSGVGGEVALTISYFISLELTAGAEDAGYTQAELVVVVFMMVVVLGGVRDALQSRATRNRSLVEFGGNIAGIFHSVSRQSLLQLLARAVTTVVPTRAVRILTLASILLFSNWMETTARPPKLKADA